ncbi:Uncharacterised protein [Vibrio cholerae]|nr:Uncharacterised protein [Vibrio cholerae]
MVNNWHVMRAISRKKPSISIKITSSRSVKSSP